ncbi:MarR family protein [Nocardioides dokdonensis FR1436]|uniref:MarR family protein n=1 Tax=Nocardioides dokdonensis FR1436 TaxID=1300347 RepID=A0A1A9GFS3_9ACTN|nr:MarR family transcriptional regulator [Nocardioides dokdonensis]ANH37137.1 MarR family protein [Nocardioides dokdonensis FR1436]
MTAPAEPLKRLEQEVSVLIRRIRRVIGLRSRAVHPELQPASYLMLSYLADQGPVRASSMAETFTIDKGAISRQVAHLTQLGLVERTQDPDDGRASLVSASPAAVARLEEVKEQRRRWIADRLDDWDPDELETFIALLSRYNEALNHV